MLQAAMIHVKAAPDHKTALPPSGGLTQNINWSSKISNKIKHSLVHI